MMRATYASTFLATSIIVDVENSGMIINPESNVAIAMGNYFFTGF